MVVQDKLKLVGYLFSVPIHVITLEMNTHMSGAEDFVTSLFLLREFLYSVDPSIVHDHFAYKETT
jgi:hypothetical protein